MQGKTWDFKTRLHNTIAIVYIILQQASFRLETTHCTHIVIWKKESYRLCEIVEPGITVMNQNREDSRVHIVLFTLPTLSTLIDMIKKPFT